MSTVLNNSIRQGTVERGMVVSGEYISQIGRNPGPSHPQHHEQRTRLPSRWATQSVPTPAQRATPQSGGISLAGLRRGYRLQQAVPCLPEGHDPGARMLPTAGPAGSHCRHPAFAARSPRSSRHRDARHRSRDHASDLGPRDTQGDGRGVRCIRRQPTARRRDHRRSVREHGVDDPTVALWKNSKPGGSGRAKPSL